MTSQKMLVDKALIFVTSFVSMYNHIMASTDTSGIEARMAPARELRLATSDIKTIKIVVTMIFSA